LFAVVLFGVSWFASAPAEAEEKVSGEGLWQGYVVYTPAKAEVEVVVELGRDAEGGLVGTIDIPSQKMKFHPLDFVVEDGAGLTFDWVWSHDDSEEGEQRIRFVYTGRVAEDGESISGLVTGWENPSGEETTFHLRRVGEAGDDRPERPASPVTTLSKDAQELRRAFQDDLEDPRLVLLISPT